MPDPYDQPSNVVVCGGEVLVNGPDGVAVSMTPEAALETAARIERAALDAMVAARAEREADG